MIGSEGLSPDILGIEMTSTVVRAVRLNRNDRKVIEVAECPVIAIDDSGTLDPSAIGPTLDEVMYQLKIDDRSDHLAAVAIGPTRSGVGSGPALPSWLEQRARQLGENLVSAGKLGISFCPQRELDTVIMICEQANLTVSRVDFTPVAASRVLKPGVDTITVGSGRGWRARLRDDEVLEALESPEVAGDEPLRIVTADGVSVGIDEFDGVATASGVAIGSDEVMGRLAAAVGAAIGIIDGSPGNLLDGDTIRGRQVPSALAGEPGYGYGDVAGSRTTVDLVRSQAQAEADAESRSMIRRVGVQDEFDAGNDEVGVFSLDAGGETAAGGGSGILDDGGTGDSDRGAVADGYVGHQPGIFGTSSGGHEVHHDDPIHKFSPEPGAEESIHGRGRHLALIVAALVLFSIAIAIGILVTQG